MAYGAIKDRVTLGASATLGLSSLPVSGGGGPARTSAQHQRANPAQAVRGAMGPLQVHTALLILVALEVLALCCGRQFFRHDHGG